MGNHVEIDSRELDRQLQNALRRNPRVTVQKVTAIALDLADRSSECAPLETGDLKNNCVAKINNVLSFENQHDTGKRAAVSTKVKATVGYSLPYALRQHEDMSLKHDKTNGKIVPHKIRFRTEDGQIHEYIGISSVNRVKGGEAKFLEKPFLEKEQDYIDMLESIPEEVLG